MKRILPPKRIAIDAALSGDKSLSHRAIIFAAMAEGVSLVRNLGSGEDVASTRWAMETLGIDIDELSSTGLRIHGGLKPSKAEIDCGNSGTTARLLTGLLAGLPGSDVILFGDVSLSRRPMLRVVEPLRAMGADIAFISNNDRLPMRIRGRRLKGMDHQLTIASAQVKSALVLAALQAEGPTTITEPEQSRNHTEIALQQMGASLTSVGKRSLVVQPLDSPLEPMDVSLPGDISSAAALLSAAALHPFGQIRLERVLANPTRLGFVDALRAMGSDIVLVPEEPEMGEATATIKLSYQPLNAIEFAADQVARAIDEIPLLALLATQAEGVSRFSGLAELRVKESDRLTECVRILSAFGADLEIEGEDLIVRGPIPLQAAEVRVGEDHRMVMLATLAALIADDVSQLEETESIGVSFPEFFGHLSL